MHYLQLLDEKAGMKRWHRAFYIIQVLNTGFKNTNFNYNRSGNFLLPVQYKRPHSLLNKKQPFKSINETISVFP